MLLPAYTIGVVIKVKVMLRSMFSESNCEYLDFYHEVDSGPSTKCILIKNISLSNFCEINLVGRQIFAFICIYFNQVEDKLKTIFCFMC